ncbi:hypothetical protein U27_03020 [Candidatus Vecturithrix granuli]|uniref:HPr kinase n=1 Tax=Vecturithrix granuli TaxID=1499967 RepID=A0A081BUQ3_VECG1|nr:hypothetical protein U27_03020 [Candidatus Vecturithrix granuli]
MKLPSVSSACFGSFLQQIPASSQIVRYYHVHDLCLKIVSNRSDLLQLFDELLGCFQSPDFSGEPSLALNLYAIPSECAPSFQIPKNWSLYDRTSHISCYLCDHALFYQYKRQGMFFADIEQGYGLGYITIPYSDQDSLNIYQNIWLLALFHIMRARNVFPLHASAALFKEKGVLIAGASGQGKTTLLLHLLRAGFQYMADDTVLLRQDADSLKMLSFPATIRITAETTSLFPELSSFIRETQPDRRGKYHIEPQKLSLLPPPHSAIPAFVLLPEITAGEETAIVPISRMAGAIQCIPQNTPVNKLGISRNNFDLLCRLFHHAQCYQLRLGQNMNSIGRQIADVMCDV